MKKKKQKIIKTTELDLSLIKKHLVLPVDHRTDFEKKKLRVMMGHEKL